MRKFVYLVLSTSLVLLCAANGMAQASIDTSDIRARLRDRQRVIEDPANSPGKVEPYDPLKPGVQPLARSPVRAMLELKVAGIADGDTLIISNSANQRLLIRIQGIDAPEAGQTFSREAQENLTNLLSGKAVTLEFDPHGKPDAEGRIIAKVYLEGRDIALDQLKGGFAWYCKDYKKEQSESDRYTYAQAEKEARLASKGLWRESAPQPPWKYRKQ